MSSFIKKRIKSAFYRLFCLKNNDLESLSTKTYSVESKRCKFHYSSNAIVEFDADGEKKFFRISMKSTGKKNIRYFIGKTIDLFFTLNNFGITNEMLALVKRDLLNKQNMFKIMDISNFCDENFYDMCAGKKVDFSCIGLPSINSLDLKGEHIHFVQFLHGSIESFKSNYYLKKGRYFNAGANRIMATRKMSELLNVSDLIPSSEICKLFIDGNLFVGAIMSEAPGINPALLTVDSRKRIDNNFIKCLSSLEYFDSICFQTDRRLDNYHVEYNNKDDIYSLSAFDNDQITTFFASPFFAKKNSISNSCILNQGSINRPFIDEQLFNSILSVEKNKIKKALSPYLTKIQIFCLILRINKLKKALKKESLLNPLFVKNNITKHDYQNISQNTYIYTFFNDTTLLDRITNFGG